MAIEGNPIFNPLVVLREEFDEWAILFDPDTGNTFGLNPMGVYIWKLMDGKHTIEDILKQVRGNIEEVPEEVGDHLKGFIQDLVSYGLAGYEIQKA